MVWDCWNVESERIAMTRNTTCPVETTLRLIGNRWKILIIRDLMGGTRRFGELKKSVGEITQKVLTSNLREMEADGLVTRTAYAEMPPRVEYSLTEAGRSLRPIIDAMTLWGEEYQRNHAAPHAK